MEETIDLNASASCKPSIKARSPSKVLVNISFSGVGLNIEAIADYSWYWNEKDDEKPVIYRQVSKGKNRVILSGSQIKLMNYCQATSKPESNVDLKIKNEDQRNDFSLHSVDNTVLKPKSKNKKKKLRWKKQMIKMGYESEHPYSISFETNLYTPSHTEGELTYIYSN